MNLNGSFKKKKVYFPQVSNYALRDNELSLKAKGLYALIQSYITIDGFVLYKSTLKKQCLEGKSAFESTWKELKDKGYLIQEKHKNSKGNFYYVYELLDENAHTPKTEGVDNLVYGKGGSYNNINVNNTYINNINSLHHLPDDGSVVSFINDYCINRFDKPLRKCNNYIDLSEFINSDTYSLKGFLDNNITKYEQCNLDYIESIQDRFRCGAY